MYPELFRIGSFPINTYGVLLAASFLVALFVAGRLGTRDGLARERVYDLGLWMLLAAILGSKILLFVVDATYRENPLQFFSLDFLRSGGVFYGGFLAAVAVGYLLARRYNLNWWKTADAFAPGIALGQAIGRQGCFAAGCCWGLPTDAAWGVEFTERAHELTGVPIGVHLHPTQLYESFATLGLFFLLIYLHRRKIFNGQVILTYAALYAVVRFTIEFFRGDLRGDLAGLSSLTSLSTSQLISLLVGATALVILVMRFRAARRAARTEAGAVAQGHARAL